jgi:HPt (histidine-containing phosphotransfer) domain-containing protein
MFDPQAILQRLGGDRPLLEKLIGVYLVEAPKLLAEAWGAMAALDWNKAGFAAHNLRGLAANIGARDLGAGAKRLEELFTESLKSGSQSATGGEAILAELAGTMEKFCEELKDYLQSRE